VRVEELPAVPEARLLRRALAGAMRGAGPAELSGTELLVRGVAVDPDHLRRYARVCGFRLSDALPATYPHVLAFPLSVELMTRPDFPFPLVGLVHIQNAIELRRPIGAAERLDLTVRAENLREHDRGRAVDLLAIVRVDDEVVWRARSSYLHRGSGSRTSTRQRGSTGPTERPPAPVPTAVWRLGTEVGSAYADVSGDRNPIHTSTLGARLLGFPRRIAHGMYSKARCVAALEGRLPDRFTVDVAFKLPVLLPATVGYSARPDPGGGWNIALGDPRTGRPHLVGTVRG
jgi:acyl dehydratase